MIILLDIIVGLEPKKLKYRTEKIIDECDLSEFISEVYGRPYNYQQQDGCKGRGVEHFTVSSIPVEDMYGNIHYIPEEVNGDEMGVSFEAWLVRDPKQPVGERTDDWEIELFWERNFYPDFDFLMHDLYKKGLIDAGDYILHIDW